MAWTAPMTAVANATWTSAQFNTHVRDNLIETMPGQFTAGGRFLAADAANSLGQRTPLSATVATEQTTTNTGYVDLTTVGPTVSLTTGAKALVFYASNLGNDTLSAQTWFSVAVSGATTIAANDDWGVICDGLAASVAGLDNTMRWSATYLFDTLTPGTNTFTMKYRVGSNTGRYANRHLMVIPF